MLADINDTNVMQVLDLETHLRDMILSNGVSKEVNTPAANGELKKQNGELAGVPPHLRSASVEEQKEYLTKYQPQSNAPKYPPKRKNKKLTQGERKKGASDQLHLVSPAPVVKQDSKTNESKAPPRRPRAQKQNEAQQELKSTGATVGVQPELPVVSTTTSTVLSSRPSDTNSRQKQLQIPVLLSSDAKSQQKQPQVQSCLTPGDGRHNGPQQGHHPHQRNFAQPRRFDHQPRGDHGHVSYHRSSFYPNRTFNASTTDAAQRIYPQRAFTHNQSHCRGPYVPQQITAPQNPFSRPPIPPNRQLFNPNQQAKEQLLDAASQLHIDQPKHVQVGYLEKLVSLEISKVDITCEELGEKEALRLVLHDLCRRIVSTYETEKDLSFDPTTVALKCFGSLSSGYATRGSDMDLVMVSPTSKPDTASPESEIPRLLEKEFLDRGYGARLLTRTRVPIIRFCEKPTPELLQLLKENRAKWEKIRDSPPPEKPKRKLNKKPKKVTTKKENGQDLEKASPLSVVLLSQQGIQTTATPPVTDNAEREDCQTDGQIGQESGNEEHISDSDEHPAEEHNGEPVKAGPMNETISNGTVLTKREDARPKKPQPERTDEELIRLYILAIGENWFNYEERTIIYRFVDTVKKPNAFNPLEIQEARIALATLPDVLSKYREKPQDMHLDFPKDGVGIQCDINFSNFLALHNTLLLRCYSHCDRRIRPMVLFVKAWAKKRKINSPYHGTLSSYGYVLMVLHYVVNIASPPLAPNLQLAWKAPPNESPANLECNGCDVRFWRSEKEIILAASRGILTDVRQSLGFNRQPVGSLLRGFFRYYAQESRDSGGLGFSWSQHVISLRTHGGILSKQEKGWIAARKETIETTVPGENAKEITHRYLLAIEDPFELNHNVARPVLHHGIVAIREEFRRANRLIRAAGFDNGLVVDLFENGTEHVQERTFFGPNPASFNRPKRFGPQNAPKNRDGGTKGQEVTSSNGNGIPVTSKPISDVLCDVTAVDVVGDGGGMACTKGEKTPDAVDDMSEESHPNSPISLKEDERG